MYRRYKTSIDLSITRFSKKDCKFTVARYERDGVTKVSIEDILRSCKISFYVCTSYPYEKECLVKYYVREFIV